jgi:hypothetical protein
MTGVRLLRWAISCTTWPSVVLCQLFVFCSLTSVGAMLLAVARITIERGPMLSSTSSTAKAPM